MDESSGRESASADNGYMITDLSWIVTETRNMLYDVNYHYGPYTILMTWTLPLSIFKSVYGIEGAISYE